MSLEQKLQQIQQQIEITSDQEANSLGKTSVTLAVPKAPLVKQPEQKPNQNMCISYIR